MKQFSLLVVMLIGLAFTAAAFSPDIGPPQVVSTHQSDAISAVLTASFNAVANHVQAGQVISLEKKGGKVLSVGILQAEDYTVPLHYSTVILSDTKLEPTLEVDYNLLNPSSEQNWQLSQDSSGRTKQE